MTTPAHPTPLPPARRPRSVTILAGLLLLQSLALLGQGLRLDRQRLHLPPIRLHPLVLDMVKALLDAQILPSGVLEGQWVGLVLVGLGMLGVLVSLALLRQHLWAWQAAMLLQGLGLLIALIGYLRGQPNYWSMLTGVFLVLYLNQYEVQSAFHRLPRHISLQAIPTPAEPPLADETPPSEETPIPSQASQTDVPDPMAKR